MRVVVLAVAAACLASSVGACSDYGAASAPTDASAAVAEDAGGTADARDEAPAGGALDAGTDARDAAIGAGPIVFATSAKYSANQLVSADALCNAAAHAAGIQRTFVAWLSTSASAARTKIVGDGPWARVDGALVAQTRSILLSGSLEGPIDVNEQGQMTSGRDVWTGSSADGTATGSDCDGWTASTSAGTIGNTREIDSHWSSVSTLPCSAVASIYCFEVR